VAKLFANHDSITNSLQKSDFPGVGETL